MEAAKHEKIDLYRLMWRIRAFEEQGNLLYRKMLNHGILHWCPQMHT
jgi:TPP-dependent pyruvate/acetoin dehydrogenase alpha subunit